MKQLGPVFVHVNVTSAGALAAKYAHQRLSLTLSYNSLQELPLNFKQTF